MNQTKNNSSILNYEKTLWEKGFKYIAGVDEVGRGPFAGPLVTSAVIWDQSFINKNWQDPKSLLHKIKDSKKLNEKTKIELAKYIKDNCLEYTIIEITAHQIDKNGVGEANKNALIEAVIKLKTKSDHVLIDHFKLESKLITMPTTSITKGDSLSLSIASASIIAKVYRDNLMKNKYHKKYPQYGFDTNVGYGTKKHKEAILSFGLTEIHRKSYNIK